MIERIDISGFKSLKQLSLKVRPITVLIGLNSSGKSSILQLLGILKQSVMDSSSSYLRTFGSLVNLGRFEDIVYERKKGNEIQIEIKGAREQFLTPPFSIRTVYSYLFTVDFNGLKNSTCTIESGKTILGGEYKRGVSAQKVKIPIYQGSLLFQPQDRIGYPFQYGGIEGNIGDFDVSRIDKLVDVVRDDLNDFFLVPAIRGLSSPNYPLDSASSSDMIDATNLNTQAIKYSSTVVYEGQAVERKINKWIGRITGITVRGRTVPDKQASVDVSRKIDVNVVNEGFGTNQLIHLFAQIAKAPSFSLIGIEEPETHLHPKAQSELAKVLIEISREERKNLILTTHSEHILYRFLIEIGKGNLKSEDLAIYHFRLSEEGITEVERLTVDERGRLEKGIPDFLETDLDEFKEFLSTLRSD